MKKEAPIGREAGEKLAVQALAFIAADPDQLGRFLAVSGLGPQNLRAAARDPRFLAGVLEFLVADEPLLLLFAEQAAASPADIARAQAALSGPAWDRDLP